MRPECVLAVYSPILKPLLTVSDRIILGSHEGAQPTSNRRVHRTRNYRPGECFFHSHRRRDSCPNLETHGPGTRPPWRPPDSGWHVDGIQFHHHLTSRDQGLLPIYLLSDINPGDGGTAVRLGSHHVTARILRDSEPQGLDVHQLAKQVETESKGRIIEVIGRAGDVSLMNPFMLHSGSSNTGNSVRFICNPCLRLHEPMRLDPTPNRPLSPVETAIARAIS